MSNKEKQKDNIMHPANSLLALYVNDLLNPKSRKK